MVDGLAAVAEYIRFSPDRVQEIQCVEKQRPAILKLLEEYDVKVPIRQRDVDKDENTAPVAARVELKAIEFNAMLARFKSRQPKIILALDHITDPRNLGAIVRSAAFFGVREVLVPERRQVLLTQAAVNTAQGGFALTDLVVTVNLTRALTALKEQGYWVIGATMNGESFTKLSGVYERTVLVMGSEDTGLSKQIIETCDRLASIAAPHSDYLTEPSRGLDSLNVSVAAGIFLCEFTKKPNATP
jgi:23S rRNA (guanosine2251-2'-O)-methyltransferase